MLGSSYHKINRETKLIMSKTFFMVLLMLSISNVFSMRGKSMYFLQRPAFQGDPPELGVGYEDPVVVDSSAAHKVLFGHYSAILENRHRQPEAQLSLAGRELDSQSRTQVRQKSQLSKIVQTYRKNFFLTIQRAVDITRGSKSSDFSSQLESCKDALKQCDKLGNLEIQCGVRCLAKGNELLNVLTDTITFLVDRFCKPINTVFDKLFEVKGKLKHPILRKFWVFLKRFGESKKSWSKLGAQGASSLVPIMIDKIRTDMMPYRLFDKKLETVLQAEELLNPITNVGPILANSLCANVTDADIAVDLLDILYRNTALVDAILGGLTSLNLVSKYVPGQFQVPFAASAEAIRIMTGSICGLVEYAATGNVPSCDQFGGFPVAGIPLPEIPDMPNLNLECFENTGNNDDDVAQGTNPFRLPDSTAPSSGRHKREVKSSEKVLVADRDGANDNANSKRLDGNGFGVQGRKRRSLIVGHT